MSGRTPAVLVHHLPPSLALVLGHFANQSVLSQHVAVHLFHRGVGAVEGFELYKAETLAPPSVHIFGQVHV